MAKVGPETTRMWCEVLERVKGVLDQEGKGLTRTGEIFGTPGFMAPEQFFDMRSVTPAADLFAMGAILYRAVTGELAYPGDNPYSVADAVRAGRYPPPPEDLPPR